MPHLFRFFSFFPLWLLHAYAMPEPLAADTATAVAQINAEMERLIRACPSQYLWGYGRYKQPRRETPEKLPEKVQEKV